LTAITFDFWDERYQLGLQVGKYHSLRPPKIYSPPFISVTTIPIARKKSLRSDRKSIIWSSRHLINDHKPNNSGSGETF
jgi:hypothetical protein